ncbi:MAG: fluoride efflux transporter CrcB [Chloroflexi bacterium]|nr:MAG: fluoride efflux transporter CrcB [Chloroflexota bacterium]
MTYVWLMSGGALGVLGRYLLAGWIDRHAGTFPLGIMVVNVSGALAIGFFLTLATTRFDISTDLQRFVATGMLGGYTTFSTLSWNTLQLLQDDYIVRAAVNALGSLALGLVAVYCGALLARLI